MQPKDQEFFSKILAALRNNECPQSHLDGKTLEFSYHDFDKDDITALFEALAHNTVVTRLQFLGCDLNVGGSAELGQCLARNTTLTAFFLSGRHCFIGDDGAKGLSQALANNTNLIALNLMANNIRREGAIALGQALTHNTGLTALNLMHNNIGNDGAKGLSQGLANNTTLTKLDLIYNTIGDEGAIALGQGLACNSTLTKLDVRIGNHIGEAAKTIINEELAKNQDRSAHKAGIETLVKIRSCEPAHPIGALANELLFLIAEELDPKFDRHTHAKVSSVPPTEEKRAKLRQEAKATGLPTDFFKAGQKAAPEKETVLDQRVVSLQQYKFGD